jgi:hypothetical protein
MSDDPLLSRRAWLAAAAALVAAPRAALGADSRAPLRRMTVYKDANCGCCKAWIAHCQQAGFTVDARDVADLTDVKRSLGLPDALASCHTGVIGPWLVEGHVPADLIARFVDRQQDRATRVAGLRGLAVPGMPMGSPGMEGPSPERYDVIAFGDGGRRVVYATRMGQRG